MERYKGYEGIDAISAVVADAKEALAEAQAEGGETAHLRGAWRSDIQPRPAVQAVTVPLIEAERVRLESEIEEVSLCHLRKRIKHKMIKPCARAQRSRWNAYVRNRRDDFENTAMPLRLQNWRRKTFWIDLQRYITATTSFFSNPQRLISSHRRWKLSMFLICRRLRIGRCLKSCNVRTKNECRFCFDPRYPSWSLAKFELKPGPTVGFS